MTVVRWIDRCALVTGTTCLTTIAITVRRDYYHRATTALTPLSTLLLLPPRISRGTPAFHIHPALRRYISLDLLDTLYTHRAMSASTSHVSAAHSANPSPLPARYKIVQLSLADLEYCKAIWCLTELLHMPLCVDIYKRDMRVFWRVWDTVDELSRHPLESGLSYGVIDTQYTYKRKESEASGGRLYWDDRTALADERALLDAMDFPLVSIAQSFDQSDPIDLAKLGPFVEAMPVFGDAFRVLDARDKRKQSDKQASTAGQVLQRYGSCTVPTYEGQGLMKGMAHWLMREAKWKGFKGIQIECAHEAVTHVWMHPPAPFTAEALSSVDTGNYEEEKEGVMVKPFAPATTVITKVFVTL